MIQHGFQGTMRFRVCVIALVAMCVSACDSSDSGSNPLAATPIPTDQPADVTASYADAFRLLRQATFGPDESSLQRARALGIERWIDEQIVMPSAYTSNSDGRLSHLQMLEQMATTVEPGLDWFRDSSEGGAYFFGDVSGFTDVYQTSVWFANALDAPDQLRQRVAYALSQIMVVSHSEFPLERRAEALAHYYDILAKHAFGNFRDLISEVSRSPAMGIYLSHQGNRKGNPSRNTLPDENFARELMQLFTIGLYELNLDGSGKTDSQGNLIPSYNQTDIEELSRVMTGWDLQFNDRYGASNQTQGSFVHFMEFNDEEHDFEAKQVLGADIPAGLTAGRDLELALDILFRHGNTAPFISKHLIQRLVTSNPSEHYVERVARVFVDNGEGVRGDLGAVVRAILLDEEARSVDTALTARFGKASEPLLAYTSLLRAFDVQPLDGWSKGVNSEEGETPVPVTGLYYFRAERELGQGALRSPSVFNFYSPDFVPQDDFYNNGVGGQPLVLPEMQLRTPQNIAGYQKLLLLHERLLERNDLIRRFGSVEAFVAQKSSWDNTQAIALVDFTPLLHAFEQALEGDQNGDFLTINSSIRNEQGQFPKEAAISRLIDVLELTLTGNQTVDAASRQQMIEYFKSDSYYNQKNLSKVDEAYRVVAGLVQYLALSPYFLAQQ
ncbi:MAG TPA: hypothetical protein DIW43_02955 [Spongiibacteraceae bacterium]|nr:hypothetical protein [Spongiibacteraceae bacterium]MBN51836.1 hypothetical protein [Spongiibacteraceae bacterium]HCS26384.1 hypothetical protein [Spongiibacteraceae bacterium]